jgi:hypothetical protein
MARTKVRPRTGDIGPHQDVGDNSSNPRPPEKHPTSQGRTDWPIADIRVGERRRRDHGDIEALAANIASVGLLQAIVITADGLLICGERRLRAAKLLGWTTIPVTIKGEP